MSISFSCRPVEARTHRSVAAVLSVLCAQRGTADRPSPGHSLAWNGIRRPEPEEVRTVVMMAVEPVAALCWTVCERVWDELRLYRIGTLYGLDGIDSLSLRHRGTTARDL